MQIPEKIRLKWKTLRSEDDSNKLADLTGKTSEGIRYIFKRGKCSDEDFQIIAKFYEEKAELIKQYL